MLICGRNESVNIILLFSFIVMNEIGVDLDIVVDSLVNILCIIGDSID